MYRVILLLTLTLGCVACGLKGPLRLPEKSAPAKVSPAPKPATTNETPPSSEQSSSSASDNGGQ